MQFNLGCVTKLQSQKILPCTFYWLKIIGVWITLNSFFFFILANLSLHFSQIYYSQNWKIHCWHNSMYMNSPCLDTYWLLCLHLFYEIKKMPSSRDYPKIIHIVRLSVLLQRNSKKSLFPKTVKQLLDENKYPYGCEFCFTVSVRVVTGFFCWLLQLMCRCSHTVTGQS